jgi:hypothetical protein
VIPDSGPVRHVGLIAEWGHLFLPADFSPGALLVDRRPRAAGGPAFPADSGQPEPGNVTGRLSW